jgi:hypothetical protein
MHETVVISDKHANVTGESIRAHEVLPRPLVKSCLAGNKIYDYVTIGKVNLSKRAYTKGIFTHIVRYERKLRKTFLEIRCDLLNQKQLNLKALKISEGGDSFR